MVNKLFGERLPGAIVEISVKKKRVSTRIKRMYVRQRTGRHQKAKKGLQKKLFD